MMDVACCGVLNDEAAHCKLAHVVPLLWLAALAGVLHTIHVIEFEALPP